MSGPPVPASLQDAAFDERPVVATAPLRPGYRRQNISRYDDTTWDLGPAVFRENARRCHVTVHFSSVKDVELAAALRAYLYARLNISIPGYKQTLPGGNIRQTFNRIRRFFEFVEVEGGVFDLRRVNQTLLDRYVKWLKSKGVTPVAVAHCIDPIFDLYHYRWHLGAYALSFEPWPGRFASTVAGCQSVRAENRTARIPEPIINALVAWSIKYVTVFAKDILAAREELTSLEQKRDALNASDAPLCGKEKSARQRKRVADYLERRGSQSRGVPLWTTSHNGSLRSDPRTGKTTTCVNGHLLHLHAGVDVRVTPSAHVLLNRGDIIEAYIARFGTEAGGMDTPITTDPETGKPWRPRFDVKTLIKEERMLQAACYVLCAYLTGMRDCEVQAMRSGCLAVTRSADGVIERHRVRSKAYKNKSPRGEPAEWITIEPVADAIRVLERLSARVTKATGTDTLWPVLAYERSNKRHISAEIVRQLNAYRDHINTIARDSCAILPGPDGKPWRITTRQFRRTIAWYIANRPFGTVAGMIQYKHTSIAAFEGYAGSSRSGFRAEVDAQRALGQIEDVLEYFDQRQAGVTPSGPAGPRIARALDAAAAELSELPAKIANRDRLRGMLKSLARTLHVGVLADCFFDPSTALCLKTTGTTDVSKPLTAICQPSRCPNACIMARHRPAWEHAAADAKQHLRQKRIPELQRIALKQDLKRISAVVDSLPTTRSVSRR